MQDPIDNFLQNIDKVQKGLINRLAGFYNRMERDANGRLESSGRNVKYVANSLTTIEGLLNKAGYFDAANNFVNEVETQIKNFTRYQGEMFSDFKGILNFNNSELEYFQNKKELANINLTEAIQPVVDDINNIVTRSVFMNEDADVVTQQIRKLLESEGEDLSKFARYAGVYAHDSMKLLNSAQDIIVAEKAKKFKIPFVYEYSGGVVRKPGVKGTNGITSRHFCRQRHGMFYSEELLDYWDKNLNWKGKNHGNTIFQTVGGFNCIHTLIPTPIKNVPPEKLNVMRSIRKGVTGKIVRVGKTKQELMKVETPKTVPKAPKVPITTTLGNLTNPIGKAKTLKEAAEHTKALGIKHSDWGNDNIEFVNHRNKALQKQLEQFPAIKEAINFYGSTNGLNNKMGEVLRKANPQKYKEIIKEAKGMQKIIKGTSLETQYRNMIKYEYLDHLPKVNEAVAYFWRKNDVNTIGFSVPDKKYTSEVFKNEAKRNIQTGFSVKIDNTNIEYSAALHEIGHSIDMYLTKKSTKYRKERFELQKKFDRMDENQFNSRYASTNFVEWIAESWCEYQLSSNPSTQAKEIGKMMKKYIKKEGD